MKHMSSIKENISFLRDFVKRRETYIRFSPTGTALMWFLYILYYFISENVAWDITDIYLFLWIAAVSLVIVTILSILNSERKWELLLPASIRHVLINLFFIASTYFLVIGNISQVSYDYVVASAFLFYGLLIIVSRSNIPRYITYFWLVCFILGMLLFWPLGAYTKEVILIGLWFGHLVMAVFLKINNDTDG